MNDENLIPTTKLTESERRELARKGGIASGKARRERADMRKLLAMMLEEQIPSKSGESMTYAERMTKSMMTIASDPKQGGAAVRAYQTILHTIGQDEPEPRQDSLDILKEILEENRKNAERLSTDKETE